MASSASPARSFSVRLVCLFTLLAALLPLIPCFAQGAAPAAVPSMAMQSQARLQAHATACQPCCPQTPLRSAAPPCCAAHPHDVRLVSSTLTLSPAAKRSLTLLPASEPALLLSPAPVSRLIPFRPLPPLSLRI